MKNLVFKRVAVILALVLLASCSVDKPISDNKIEKDELVFAANPEPVKGKLDVYDAMARSVKYNVDVASQNLNKKIYIQDPNLTPKEVIQNVMNIKGGSESPLYDASRVLEFAIIYAMANLSDNQVFSENYFYTKSSQHLALAAIKSHKDTLFARKKIKEIKNMENKELKNLYELNKKNEKIGSLPPEDLEYKKGLEVALLKLSETKGSLAFNVVEYGQLVKADDKKVELEGRQFYELEDFDKKYTIETFQAAALRNRTEIAKTKEKSKVYDLQELKAMTNINYPEIERLDINGLDVGNDLYGESLQKRAVKIADVLVESVESYKRAKKPQEKSQLLQASYDELQIAILAQIEIAYNIVKQADSDYDLTQQQIKALRREVLNMDKSYRLNNVEKIDLLDKKVDLLQLELKASQISGERAMALRSLYFYAGFSPFDKQLLRLSIADIVKSLKQGFNKDVVEMLAASPKIKKSSKVDGNDWAKEDNWLEKLVDGPKPENSVKLKSNNALKAVMSLNNFEPYVKADADKFKVMQLGSYLRKENAHLEWQQLVILYPELAEKKPRLEKAKVNDNLYYRLVINSSEGGFVDLCNKLRADRVECILK